MKSESNIMKEIQKVENEHKKLEKELK